MAKKKEVGESKILDSAKAKKSREEQLKLVLILMGIVLAAAIATYFVIDGFKKFDYGGLKYEEILFDKMPFYHGKLPLRSITGEVIANYNLYLRNDPRELEDISVLGNVYLLKNTLVSITPEAEQGCEDSGIAGASLFSFLQQAARINVQIAYTDEAYAEEKNALFAVCDGSADYSTIVIMKGEKNEIRQDSQNCYTLEFKDCEIMKVVERFEVAAIAHAKGLEV